MLDYQNRLIKAKVVNVQPNLGHGYHKGHVVAVWPDTGKYDDEQMWRVCRTDGCADRRLTTAQVKHSLESLKDENGSVILWSESESKKISEHHWFDMTR